MTLKNFLQSGYEFSDDEYELKSKFKLMNTMFTVGLLLISILTFFLFLDGKIAFVIFNSIYVLVNVYLVYALRLSRNAYKYIIPVISLSALVLLAIVLVIYPEEQVRIAWFLVLIILSFFLGGSMLGMIATVLSMITIVAVGYLIDTDMDEYTTLLATAIVFLGAIFIDQYERRSKKAREILLGINQGLEKKIKEETHKRVRLYKKNNQKLIESAEMLEEQKAVFEHLAHHDTLTSLPNRILFRDRLEHAINIAKRHSKKLAVLFMDLDHFKEINDSLGHQLGDEVLQIIAERLRKELRGSDSIARLGGDEFTVLIEDLKDDSEIGKVAQKLIQAVKEPIIVKSHKLYLTVSIGISIYPDDGEDAETLLKNADAAMYSAKRSGRNAYHYFSKEMTDQAFERVMIEASMRRALEEEEFVLYYQPQINSKTGELNGLEALVRWNHPEMGLVPPEKFIALAEATELIVPLGEWVMRTAALQIVAWKEDGFTPTCVSVNLSVKQLRHKGVVSMIENILQETKCKPNWLELEITESYTMQNPNQSIELLKRIRKIGISLAIDDFGTGYSSLSYLKRLPISKLKIDKSFIDDIPGSKEDEAIVGAIVSMAESMSLGVVAEGVERDVQKAFLQQVGCNIIQGYFYAEPMPADEITEMLKEKR
ncbi:MAG: EAL domain-containing protein [Campylobacterota bacterium]|nr:EAL domain-containing protein [Campylobacterota bacterium]